MAKKILVKNGIVVDVSDATFEVHPDTGTWQDCSNDNVKKEWTVNSDNSVSAPVEPEQTYEKKDLENILNMVMLLMLYLKKKQVIVLSGMLWLLQEQIPKINILNPS